MEIVEEKRQINMSEEWPPFKQVAMSFWFQLELSKSSRAGKENRRCFLRVLSATWVPQNPMVYRRAAYQTLDNVIKTMS